MSHPNLDLIDRFFAAYGQHDFAALREVVAENVTWHFPGRNPLNGTRTGIEEVAAFFDAMGRVMGGSNIQVDALISAVNDSYVVQAQHIITHRDDGHNLDHEWCVLWRFENGKIAGGKHLAADQYAADEFFNWAVQDHSAIAKE
jgi:ketosteroid isomerase-like protein